MAQVHMPRMSDQEIRTIVTTGLQLTGMMADDEVPRLIVLLSQGLPHYAHLLAQEASLEAVRNRRTFVEVEDLLVGIDGAVRRTEHSVRDLYHAGIDSPRQDCLHKDVLLSCALVQKDGREYFRARAIRAWLRSLTGKDRRTGSYTKNLNALCQKGRGPCLVKEGEPRNFRYRFAHPLLQQYVLMAALRDNRVRLALSRAEDSAA